MQHLYTRLATDRRALVLPLLFVLTAFAGRAQAPSWGGVVPGSLTQTAGGSITQAVATDASGNVFVTGYFTGQVYFGSILLTSRGGEDLFVAKYVPGSNTWAWAQSGGGNNNDEGLGIAVSGNSIYVTGTIFNTSSNSYGVFFGGTGTTPGTVQVNGASSGFDYDLVLAKYTDNGTSGTLRWTQVGGGTGSDAGLGIAVSNTSVYVTGYFTNSTSNANAVVFGATGTTPGTATQAGASGTSSPDLLLAKYTDNGSTATLRWMQVGGGTGNDVGHGIAVSGTSVYVTGQLTNSLSNGSAALFGGSGVTPGTVQVNGASVAVSGDLLLARYTDNGTTASFAWAQIGGGTNTDSGQAVAVNGTSLYVTGSLYNSASNTNAVLFGSSNTTPGTVQVSGASTTSSADLLLVRYTDTGNSAALVWTQVGGGTGYDSGFGVALSGTYVYVTGIIYNNTGNTNNVLFGGAGPTPGTAPQLGASPTSSYDFLLAKYIDNGSTGTLGWTQVGGGSSADEGYGIVVSGQNILAAGTAVPSASFGNYPVSGTPGLATTLLAYLTDPALPLPTRSASVSGTLTLYPNPAGGTASLTDAPAGQAVQVLDALGRPVATATADATGTARLVGLAPGLYLVRAGAATARLAVE